MNLYTKSPEFSRKTGKQVGESYSLSGAHICDYSGLLIPSDVDYEHSPLYSLNADYNRDCEEIYSEDEEGYELKKLGMEDYGKLFEANFVFQPYITAEGVYTDQSLNMLFEWGLDRQRKTGIYKDCVTIEEIMRKSRARVALKLIKDKTYSLEELGLID
jgi:hypothetical protein